MKPTRPTRRELWGAHLLYSSGQPDTAKLQRAVDELGLTPPRTRPTGKVATDGKPSEQAIVNAVLKMCRLHPRVAMVWRQNVGMAEFDGQPVRFGFVGQPDICGFLRTGRALFMEVKRPGRKMTEAQAWFMQQAQDAGCCAGCVTSVDEAVALLEAAGVWRVR